MADISKIQLPSGVTYDIKDETARTIAAKNWFGTNSEAANTSTRSVSISDFTSSNFQNGTIIIVYFQNAQDYDGMPKLNINAMGAKNIKYTDSTNSEKGAWTAGSVVTFVYYSDEWYMDRRDYLTLTTLPIYDGTVV